MARSSRRAEPAFPRFAAAPLRLAAASLRLASAFLPLAAAFLGLAAPCAGLATSSAAVAQDANFLHPVDYIEARLAEEPLRVVDMEQARPLIEDDRSARVVLGGPPEGLEADVLIEAKWKPVHRGAEGFNNEPRYELAAYRFQKLFLDEPDYVVPPTVLRSMPLEEYQELMPASRPTLSRTSSVLFLLSYWVQHVTNREPFQPMLFQLDTVYARHWGNLNILTHLIDHKDDNVGNLLVSLDPANPRVFAVDNDVAFGSKESDVGDRWRHLQVDRLPRATIERLRAITRQDLDDTLGVVAEFEIVDGHLVPTEPGENLRPRRGVRVTDDRVQLGLTSREIRDVERRIERLLRDVDRGRIATF